MRRHEWHRPPIRRSALDSDHAALQEGNDVLKVSDADSDRTIRIGCQRVHSRKQKTPVESEEIGPNGPRPFVPCFETHLIRTDNDAMMTEQQWSQGMNDGPTPAYR